MTEYTKIKDYLGLVGYTITDVIEDNNSNTGLLLEDINGKKISIIGNMAVSRDVKTDLTEEAYQLLKIKDTKK